MPDNKQLSIPNLRDNRFLYIMGMTMAEIDLLSKEEIADLKKEIEVLKVYFRSKLPFTDLFISSVKGKIGALNSKLLSK